MISIYVIGEFVQTISTYIKEESLWGNHSSQ